MTLSNFKYPKKSFAILLILICCIPALCTAFLINKHSVNIFSIDDQFFANYFDRLVKLDIPSITKDLLATVNGHVFLVPKLILAPLAFLNIWNTKIPILIGWIFAGLSTLCITCIFAKNSKLSSDSSKIYLVFAASVVTNLVYFSPAASENWIISVQISQFLCIFFFIAILTTLTFVRGHKSIVMSSFLGLMASFSYGFGFISYIAVYPTILYLGIKLYSKNVFESKNYIFLVKQTLLSRYSIFWFISSLLVFILYVFIISNNNSIASVPGLNVSIITENAFRNISKCIIFLLQITGSPFGLGFSEPYQVSLAWGAILLSLFFVFLAWLGLNRKKIYFPSYLPWMSLGIFAILANSLTSISRAPMAINQALNPRYISVSSLLIISITLMFLLASQEEVAKTYKNITRKLLLGLAVLLSIASFYSYVLTWKAGLGMTQYISGLRLQSQVCVTYVQECPDQFIQRTISLPLFQSDYPVAKKLGMVKSSDIFEQVSSISYGNIDNIQESKTDMGSFDIWGWAIPPNDVWAATVVITKETSKRFVALASANQLSPDLSSYLKDEKYSQFRWTATIQKDLLDEGQNIIKAWTFDNTHNKLIQFGETKTVFRQPVSKRNN